MSRLGLIALLRVALLSVLLAALPGQAQIIRISVDQFLGDVDAGSAEAVVNGAGSLIAFESDATNLVSGDTNGMKDVFVHQQTSLQ